MAELETNELLFSKCYVKIIKILLLKEIKMI